MKMIVLFNEISHNEMWLAAVLLLMFLIVKKHKRKGRRRVVDLYHIMSRCLYYDLETKELIREDEAREIGRKIAALNWRNKCGEVRREQSLKADVWNNGKESIISGNIYLL